LKAVAGVIEIRQYFAGQRPWPCQSGVDPAGCRVV